MPKADYDEICPGCNKKMTWDNDMDWYCIGDSPTNITEIGFEITPKGLDGQGIELLICPHCNTLVAISAPTIEGQELFINSNCLSLANE